MAEIIRDVAIRVHLALVDDKALKGGVAQIRQATAERLKQAGALKQTTQYSKLGADIQKQKLLLMREEISLSRQRESRLKSEIELEKQRLQLQRQQMGLASGATRGAAAPRQSKRLRDPSVMIGGTELKFAKIAAGVMIIDRLPDALLNLASGKFLRDFATLGRGIIEGMRTISGRLGISGETGIGASGAVAGAMAGTKVPGPWWVKAIASAVLSTAGWFGGRKVGRDAPVTEEHRLALAVGLNAELISLKQEELAIAKALVPAEREQLAIVREKIAGAKAEFGLMNFEEKEAMVATFRRADKVGISGLGLNEIDFLRSKPGLAKLLEEKATAETDTPASRKMMAELLARSGVGDASKFEEDFRARELKSAAIKIGKLDILGGLKVTVDTTADRLIELLSAEVKRLLEESYELTTLKFKAEMKRLIVDMEGARAGLIPR